MKLTAAKRNALPTKDFAVPGKRAFPIENASHARDALARVADKGPAVKAEVKAKVASKFPDMDHGKIKPKAASRGTSESHPTSHEAFHKLGDPGEGKY